MLFSSERAETKSRSARDPRAERFQSFPPIRIAGTIGVLATTTFCNTLRDHSVADVSCTASASGSASLTIQPQDGAVGKMCYIV